MLFTGSPLTTTATCLNDIAFSYVFSKPQDGKQTVSVFMAKGDDARSIEAVGTEIFSDVPVSFGPGPNHC